MSDKAEITCPFCRSSDIAELWILDRLLHLRCLACWGLFCKAS
jgi:Zn ribbon nucleic-acid-binding protein